MAVYCRDLGNVTSKSVKGSFNIQRYHNANCLKNMLSWLADKVNVTCNHCFSVLTCDSDAAISL